MTQEAPGAARLEAALGALLPPGAAAALRVGPIDPDHAPALHPDETAAVRRAVPSRRAEFAHGRACAREALGLLGCGHSGAGPGTGIGRATSDSATADAASSGLTASRAAFAGLVPIPVGASREPLWPAGFTGSITHCEGLVAAAVAPMAAVHALGIDAEPARPLPDEVRERVLHSRELNLPDDVPDTMVFSAKEAVHKAVFPLTGAWLEFLDVRIEVEAADGSFRVVPMASAPHVRPALTDLVGRYAVVGGLVLTLVHFPSSPGL